MQPDHFAELDPAVVAWYAADPSPLTRATMRV